MRHSDVQICEDVNVYIFTLSKVIIWNNSLTTSDLPYEMSCMTGLVILYIGIITQVYKSNIF